MKNSKAFLLGIIIIITSCKPEYIKIKDNLEGSWKLTNFEYLNIQNTIVTGKKDYTMTFNGSNNKGILLINATKYDFTYDFGYEKYDTGYSTCNIDVEKEMLLPIEGVGKAQVYSYKFINKDTIEFYVDKEYDFASKQIIKNVKYTFLRI